jgi:hypothetical protein
LIARTFLAVCVLAAAVHGGALAAAADAPKAEAARPAKSTKGEVAKADENRKKPLQRCDELKDNAQLECLRKARQRVVEERNKREAKPTK